MVKFVHQKSWTRRELDIVQFPAIWSIYFRETLLYSFDLDAFETAYSSSDSNAHGAVFFQTVAIAFGLAMLG